MPGVTEEEADKGVVNSDAAQDSSYEARGTQ